MHLAYCVYNSYLLADRAFARQLKTLTLRKHTGMFSPGKMEKKNQQKMFDIFLIFAQNIDCGYTLETSTHNLCFGAKIRKIGIPLHTSVLLYKSGVSGGVVIAWTCFPDG